MISQLAGNTQHNAVIDVDDVDTTHDANNNTDHHDPNQVENLLTQELLQLSFKDRTDNQEEIHGVKCLAPIETPELIELSLYCLVVELEQQTSHSSSNSNHTSASVSASSAAPVVETYKQAYLLSQSFQEGRNFVNARDFQLRFLRLEFFDSKKAAIRIMKFLFAAHALFGVIALWRPIQLEDFTSAERKDFRKARYQLLPQRAHGTGRLVMCSIPDETYTQIPIRTRNKIMMYILWVIGSDVDTQRRGIVVLMLFDVNSFSNLAAVQSFRNAAPNTDLFCVRGSGIHFCTPDTPFYRLIRSLLIAKVVTRDQDRSRVQLHTGTAIELRYILQGYGIATDHLPMTYTGKVKDVYWRHWMRSRLMIEEQQQQQQYQQQQANNDSTHHNDNYTTNANVPGSRYGNDHIMDTTSSIRTTHTIVTEAPYLYDILFKQGTQLTNHPGNIALRNLIQYKVKQQYDINNNNNNNNTIITTKTNNSTKQVEWKTKTVISSIVDEIQQNSNNETVRFLHWNKNKDHYTGSKGKDNDYGWWEQLHPTTNEKDREVIILKVKWLFRECAKLYRKKRKVQAEQIKKAVQVSTSIENQKNQNKRKERDPTTTPTSMQSATSSSSSLSSLKQIDRLSIRTTTTTPPSSSDDDDHNNNYFGMNSHKKRTTLSSCLPECFDK